jgi:tellurium resistance protein TerD
MDEVRCPVCSSAQIAAHKEGFGFKKAIAGGILVAPLGLLAGFIGSKKIKITCLNCGHKWEAGKS